MASWSLLLVISNFVLISGWVVDMFWFYLSSMAYWYICLHYLHGSSPPSYFLTFVAFVAYGYHFASSYVSAVD